MLYTNYKQVAYIVLKSNEADFTREWGTKLLGTVSNKIYDEYTFNIKLPYYKFTKNTKLALETFTIEHEITNNNGKKAQIGDVYIKNIHKANVFSKNKEYGCPLLSTSIGQDFFYNNTDVINKSIDITNNTGFLESNPLTIFVNTRILDDTNAEIKGCPESSVWSMTLYVYEEVKEENEKDFSRNESNPYSRPPVF